MLGERLKKTEMTKAGAGDAFEEHRERPLTEHLDDFRKALLADNNTDKHAKLDRHTRHEAFRGMPIRFHERRASVARCRVVGG